ncbi:MAG: sterol desaturase family protein, partial [Pseudomonadota bacterium]
DNGVALSLFAGFLLWFCAYELFHDFEHHEESRGAERDFASSVEWVRRFLYDSQLGQRFLLAQLKSMKAHHDRHHNQNWKGNFGVSTQIWDRVFLTHIT